VTREERPLQPAEAFERRARALALAVALFAAALFAVVIGNGLALDDAPLIRENPFIRSLGNVPRFFTSDYWEPRLQAGLYRPLVTTSYALNHAAGRLDPRGYHLLNLLLHAANSALILLLLRRWTGQLALAAAAAFLFAAHAVHAEVLANIASGRPELMAAFFFLLALLGYPCARDGQTQRRVAPWSLACFGLALLCKESAITLLVILPLADAVFGQGAAPSPSGALRLWRERAGVYAAYAVVALAYLGIRWLALGGGETLPAERDLDNPLLMLPAGWRVVNALHVALLYTGLLFWPLHLSYDYSFDRIPMIRSFDDPQLYVVFAATALAAWLLVASARRSRPVFFGVAFALLTFSVVSNLLLPIGTIMAERLLYLPSLGFCLALAAGLRWLARRIQPSPRRASRVFVALTALLVVLHGARAIDRSLDWRSENGLYLHDLEVSPRSTKIQSNAGAALAEMERHEEALRCYAAAIAIAPDFSKPYQGSVLSLLALGRFEEAQVMYQETLRFGPPVPAVEEAIRQGLARSGRGASEGARGSSP
jgi:tetratricopeptide (TPR) repeat protein